MDNELDRQVSINNKTVCLGQAEFCSAEANDQRLKKLKLKPFQGVRDDKERLAAISYARLALMFKRCVKDS